MMSFVLVHGGAHAGWCWSRLIPFLERDSRVGEVLAVDLCGHGAEVDTKPFLDIEIADYVESVVRTVETEDLRDVVLVGHSLAGLTLPNVAAEMPDRFARMVYLSTTNPPIGRSVLDEMSENPLFETAGGSDINELFCSDLDEESGAWLIEHLGPQPPGPLDEKVKRLRGPESVPATYILLEGDKVLSPAYQAQQAERLGIDDVLRLDAGHSAFASQPEELAALLLGLLPS